MTVELLIAMIALGVGIGTFIGLILHIIFGGDDFTAMHAYITDIDKEKADLQLENDSLHCKIIGLEGRLSSLHKAYGANLCSVMEYKIINDKLSEENTALKLKINEMEESRRTTLDHNAYLSKEARRLEEENKELTRKKNLYNKCYRVVVTETVAKFKDKFEDAVKYRVMTPVLGALLDRGSFNYGVNHTEAEDISLINKIADEIEREIDNE